MIIGVSLGARFSQTGMKSRSKHNIEFEDEIYEHASQLEDVCFSVHTTSLRATLALLQNARASIYH